GAAVYDAIVDEEHDRYVLFHVLVGDGAKDLDGTGGEFKLRIAIDGIAFDGAAQIKEVSPGATRAWFQAVPLMVPLGYQVTITIISPNSADSEVSVTVQAYDLAPL